MWETSGQSLIPIKEGHKTGPMHALTVGFEDESLAELARLLDTLEIEIGHREFVVLRQIHPATYIGQGKLEEIKNLKESTECDFVVFDIDLSPKQLRNLEKELECPVLDRSGVIIEIFSRHAQTKEAKVQVELAKLQYLLPRLAGMWTHFERQRGGIGMKGMGETQIEVDRRLIKKRMSVLKAKLVEIEKARDLRRKGREDVLKVAIVGYTNAGKSTLLNALTHSKVVARDQLFATLDSSVRSLNPEGHPPVVAIDTVGFIRNLPTSLIASFRSTLEAVKEADLILQVIDASSSQAIEEAKVTDQVLNELGAGECPRMVVLNKADCLKGPGERNRAKLSSPKSQLISALDKEDVAKLRKMILERFIQDLEVWDVMIPFTESKLLAQLHENSSIDKLKHMEKGTFVRMSTALRRFH